MFFVSSRRRNILTKSEVDFVGSENVRYHDSQMVSFPAQPIKTARRRLSSNLILEYGTTGYRKFSTHMSALI
jgi:hypothetical protein